MAVDTIVALATPPGRGGVGVIRVSGERVARIAATLIGELPPPRRASLRDFRDDDGSVLDQGIALYFPSPHSFTGEAVLELQGHGGPVVLDLLLARCLQLGARLARPGEFSERAFLNGKLDLAQAEAIADLIDAETAAAARLATRSLQGVFSQRIDELQQQLTALRSYIEAALDFPDEEIDFLQQGEVSTRLAEIIDKTEAVRQAARTGSLLRDGMSLVIAGPPNAGKSSLLNALAGSDRAIVTDIPGTTRDLLRERIQLDGMPLHLIDTAGLRETDDPIEREGVRRARAELERADLLLWVFDGAADPDNRDFAAARLPPGVPVLLLRNKSDLFGGQAAIRDTAQGREILLSLRSGEGLALLRQELKAVMGYPGAEGGEFLARRRHLNALERALTSLQDAIIALQQTQAGELVAEELRHAQLALGEITGSLSADDLLGEIFASFCIGK